MAYGLGVGINVLDLVDVEPGVHPCGLRDDVNSPDNLRSETCVAINAGLMLNLFSISRPFGLRSCKLAEGRTGHSVLFFPPRSVP